MEPSNGKSALEQLAADKLLADQAALPGGAPLAPAKLDEADRLAVENIYLKLQYLKGQVDLCDSQKMLLEMQKKDVGQQMLALQEQMKKKRDELTLKYGTPIDAASVLPDGTIRTKPAPSPRPPTMVTGTLTDGTPVSIPADAIAPSGSAIKAA
jgi:hypothetical protein